MSVTAPAAGLPSVEPALPTLPVAGLLDMVGGVQPDGGVADPVDVVSLSMAGTRHLLSETMATATQQLGSLVQDVDRLDRLDYPLPLEAAGHLAAKIGTAARELGSAAQVLTSRSTAAARAPAPAGIDHAVAHEAADVRSRPGLDDGRAEPLRAGQAGGAGGRPVAEMLDATGEALHTAAKTLARTQAALHDTAPAGPNSVEVVATTVRHAPDRLYVQHLAFDTTHDIAWCQRQVASALHLVTDTMRLIDGPDLDAKKRPGAAAFLASWRTSLAGLAAGQARTQRLVALVYVAAALWVSSRFDLGTARLVAALALLLGAAGWAGWRLAHSRRLRLEIRPPASR